MPDTTSGVSFETDQLDAADRLYALAGYQSRSEMIRDALDDKIQEIREQRE